MKCEVEKIFLEFIPTGLAREISRLCLSRGKSVNDISELRIRHLGNSSAVICGERVPLLCAVTEDDVKKCFYSSGLTPEIKKASRDIERLDC